MKIKYLLLLPGLMCAIGLFAQQTLVIDNGGLFIMDGDVKVVVDGGLNLSSSSEIKINGGTLSLDAVSTLTNDGVITNNSTISNGGNNDGLGTYQGTGAYNGSLYVNSADGTVSPGLSPGCLTFQNGFTNLGFVQLEIDGTAIPCSDFDQIVVNGTATLGGTLFAAINYTPAAGDLVTIIDATALSGTFDDVTSLPTDWTIHYNYPATGKVSLAFMACPVVSLDPVNETVCEGILASFESTANGVPTPMVQWQVSTDGGMTFNNINGETNTSLSFTPTVADHGNQYQAVFTNDCGTATSLPATLTVYPAESTAFSYSKGGYCQLDANPIPIIDGTTGGVFSAPPAVSINNSTGEINLAASTAGGPYMISYNTNGPCAVSANVELYIENCQPIATLTDMLVLDNAPVGSANVGDRIQLTATISNTQSADYEDVQLTLTNNPAVTFVPGTFKSTPVAVNDAYVTSMNIQLIVPAGSGVLQNDFDDAGLTVSSFDMVSSAGGTVAINANGSFTYNPPNSFTGYDTFTYTVTDSDTQTNMGTVKIKVQ